MGARREEEQALYDVIYHMVGNVVTSLQRAPYARSEEYLTSCQKAAAWGGDFLSKLDGVMDDQWRYKGSLHVDLNDNSWTLRIKATKKVYTVDYRNGEYLFTTGGEEYYHIGMTDPNNPSIRRG